MSPYTCKPWLEFSLVNKILKFNSKTKYVKLNFKK